MQNISSEQMITIFGIFLMFALAFGISISVRIKDRKSHRTSDQQNEHLKIFGHKGMLYNDESDDVGTGVDESTSSDDLGHPHAGIGATHVDHLH